MAVAKAPAVNWLDRCRNSISLSLVLRIGANKLSWNCQAMQKLYCPYSMGQMFISHVVGIYLINIK